MLTTIRRGDQVVTGGGIVGKVTKVIDDNELEVEIADGVEVRVGARHDRRSARQGRAGQDSRNGAIRRSLRASHRATPNMAAPTPERSRVRCCISRAGRRSSDLARRLADGYRRAVARPTCFPAGRSRACPAGAAQADDARSRPAGRLAHHAAGRPRDIVKERLEAMRRRGPPHPARGQYRLYRACPATGQVVRLRIRDAADIEKAQGGAWRR